ncbi:hypothetical protein D3C87_95770 [compost metagenome]
MKTALRKITVDGDLFLWKREHVHGKNHKETGCTEKVTVYLEGSKRAPLYLFFNESDNQLIKDDPEKEKWCVGYPESGVIWLYKYKPPLPPGQVYSAEEQQTAELNLNRPAAIETLIRHYLSNGWNPRTTMKPFVDNTALNILEIIPFPNNPV